MIIKDGVNGKETTIKVVANSEGCIQLWIQESGKDNRESLSYLTPSELLELFNEVKRAGIELFN